MGAADLEAVLYEVNDGVTVITLNRPDKLNAWNAQLSAELGEAMATADADDAVREVVVTGAGRAFCAGADLSAARFGGGNAVTLRECWPNEVRKPVIAANTAPVSVALAKQLLWDGMTRSVSDMRTAEGPLFAKVTSMPDASEGVTAFLEKRAPQWCGRVGSDLPQ